MVYPLAGKLGPRTGVRKRPDRLRSARSPVTLFDCDYPKGGALSLSGAHFSGLIGAPHNDRYRLFGEGTLATRGLELLSHKGSKSPLDDELKAAAAAGNAGELFDTVSSSHGRCAIPFAPPRCSTPCSRCGRTRRSRASPISVIILKSKIPLPWPP